MSLINQMLKDLEQRGAKPTEVQPSVIPHFGGASTKSSNSRALAIIGISLVIIALSYTIFLAFEQPNRMQDLLGKTSTKVDLITRESKEIESAKFGQPILDKGITNELLPDEPINSANDANEANIKTNRQLTVQPKSLFETTLRYNTDNNLAYQPEKSAKPDTLNTEKDKSASVNNSEKKTITLNEPKIESSELSKKETNTAPFSKSTAQSANPSKSIANINKKISPEQNASTYYQQALIYLQQGRVAESQANLAKALEFSPTNHEARLTLASLLLDNKRLNDAKEVLNAGVQLSPEQNEFRIALARLQINAGDSTTALNTLEQGLEYAENHADYQAFIATLLQRSNRHDDAVKHYMKAVSLETNAGSVKTHTLVGLGISLQSLGKLESAQQTFIKAQQTGSLGPALSSFVEQQLKKINQSLDK